MPDRYERDHGDRLEDILDGREHDDPVAQLLDAARAPATPAELSGLAAAAAAFADSPMLPPTAPLPGSRRRLRSLGKSIAAATITTKILAGAAAAAAVGGIAVASAAGHDSAPPPMRLFGSSSTAASAAASPYTSRTPDASGHDSSHAATLPTHARPAPARPTLRTSTGRATPNPSLQGLCEAWAAHSRQRGGHASAATHSSAFRALIVAAGGIGKVDGYCAAHSTSPTSQKPKVPPGRHGTKHVKKPRKPHPARPTHAHGTPHATKHG